MRRTTMVAAGALTAAAAALVLGRRQAGPDVAGTVAPAALAATAADRAATPPAVAATTAAATAQREPVPAGAPPAGEFRVLLRRLLAVVAEGRRAFAAGERQRATTLDAEARGLFGRLLTEVADPAARSLFELSDPRTHTDDDDGSITRTVLGRIVTLALDRAHQRATATGERAELDGMVAAVLDALPQNEVVAEALAPSLVDHPYLGAAHEPAVASLTDLAAEATYLQPIARGLLLTLWRNLRAAGVSTGNELEALAMLWQEDRNPVRRAAAMETLVLSDDQRFVDLVLAELGDDAGERIAELALAAARRQEPARAVATLRRLRRGRDADLAAATITLALRASAPLRQAYVELLGDAADAPFRADLVTGLGFAATPADIELAREAFDCDPSPLVRTRALFTLTARAAGTHGAAAVARALDDRELIGADGAGLGAIVLALQNLANAGDVDAVARFGRRLTARPDLLPMDRENLDRILANTLPEELRRGWR